ncbi:winged helix-turn-helix transcriptional regulator [Candidatus Micrarchaeota archaeon]|nr:winged helix-turn-helix transcriptional regulator [Candidatus Micrarchaeota archaeon]
MELKFEKRKTLGKSSLLIVLLLIGTFALFYQNVLTQGSFSGSDGSQFIESSAKIPVPTDFAAGSSKDALVETTPANAQIVDAGVSTPESLDQSQPVEEISPMRSAKIAATPVAGADGVAPDDQAFAIASENTSPTPQEKTLFQSPYLYYAAIALLGIMLLLNIFKVSFASTAVFDSEIFKTLSSETRVEMLYSLQTRRKTLSELAQAASISLPGAKQHLQLLEAKGLVRKIDEGRKWKYYELTDVGKSILAERFA